MNKIQLHLEELKRICDFLEQFSESPTVIIEQDGSSGIGSTIRASVYTLLNNDYVTVTKEITSERDW